ncbi:MAG TPA: double-strand break repair protein AddB [Rhizomicrobium sp.]|nr:double-strand break repair protein AddB [Rhizomicrobium sp.]
MIPNVFTIAAGEPFAETLARGLIETLGTDPLALAAATIYLPTRRAVRTLSETFAKLLGGAALLPNLRPLGDVDDEPLLFDPSFEDLALPPSLSPIRRRLLLSALVARWDSARHDGAMTFAQASLLARALGRFLDETETQGASLDQLDDLAPAALAEHWAEVRDFLVLLREEWPKLLAAENAIEPAARRNLLLDALAAYYAKTPPHGPVIAAGTTGSIPATARLLAALAKLPNGAVILPGLDRALDEASWNALDPGHAQYGMRELIARLGIARADVRDWRGFGDAPRVRLLRETLRPAPTTDAWRAIADRTPPRPGGMAKVKAQLDLFPAQGGVADLETIRKGLAGLSLVEAAHPGEEALAIALILREALETPRRTAALVTPDRGLARRVAAALGRWKIVIDDSAGRPLANTPPGAFLLLLTEAVMTDFAPVPLLALLKHPLTAAGSDPAEFRRMARRLDMRLRGPRPDPGLDGVARAIAQGPQDLQRWFGKFSARLAPFAEAFALRDVDVADMAEAHARAAEQLAASDTQKGADRLWRGEAGTAAAELFAGLTTEARGLPAVEPASYAVFIRTLMEERAVRPAYGRHPRLQILGPLEARLQSFDVVVLGGLNEGTWPASVAADPWLSRPMRETLGLASPERAIGLAAHDFSMLAAGPRVFLTRALKADGAPTVASRWLQRLKQLTDGLDLDLDKGVIDDKASYVGCAAALEVPDIYVPEDRPAPAPPVTARPRTLSVTEIETWLRDPYAIYAKHILKLRPLDPLDAEIGPLERGTAIHRILELFLKEWGDVAQLRPEERFVAIADQVFGEAGIPHATLAVWRPRFLKAARWFVGEERKRRAKVAESHVEIKGTRAFEAPAGAFILRGRADRIDVLRRGGAEIIDYKTGSPPTQKQVQSLIAPQLPLEGAILAEGGFPGLDKVAAAGLVFIQFGGGAVPGRILEIENTAKLVPDAERKLLERIADFDSENTPYLPRLVPFRKDIEGDYDHLSRVREWSVTSIVEEEE